MRKNKKLLLGGLSVLTLVAAGSGAVSTFAWWQTTASITASSDLVAFSSFSVESETLSASDRKIDFTFYEDSTFNTALSTVTLHLSELSGTNLLEGVYNTTTSTARTKAATAANVLQEFHVKAAWHDSVAGFGADEIAKFKDKRITGATLTAGGNVKLLASASATTSISNEWTSADITIDVANDNNLGLTVALEHDVCAVRIDTNNKSGAEYWEAGATLDGTAPQYGQTTENKSAGATYHHTDKLEIAAVAELTIGSKS